MIVGSLDTKRSGIGVQINGMNAIEHSPPTEEKDSRDQEVAPTEEVLVRVYKYTRMHTYTYTRMQVYT